MISSPAKSTELGLIKSRIAAACLASTETIFPAIKSKSALSEYYVNEVLSETKIRSILSVLTQGLTLVKYEKNIF